MEPVPIASQHDTPLIAKYKDGVRAHLFVSLGAIIIVDVMATL